MEVEDLGLHEMLMGKMFFLPNRQTGAETQFSTAEMSTLSEVIME